MSYKALILIPPTEKIVLENISLGLEKFLNQHNPENINIKVAGKKNKIDCSFNKWKVRINYNDNDDVLAESIDLAKNYGKEPQQIERISKCNARFEIATDSDGNMDHFNDYTIVVEQLLKIPGSIGFDPQGEDFI
jgi:hypothetical protein